MPDLEDPAIGIRGANNARRRRGDRAVRVPDVVIVAGPERRSRLHVKVVHDPVVVVLHRQPTRPAHHHVAKRVAAVERKGARPGREPAVRDHERVRVGNRRVGHVRVPAQDDRAEREDGVRGCATIEVQVAARPTAAVTNHQRVTAARRHHLQDRVRVHVQAAAQPHPFATEVEHRGGVVHRHTAGPRVGVDGGIGRGRQRVDQRVGGEELDVRVMEPRRVAQ